MRLAYIHIFLSPVWPADLHSIPSSTSTKHSWNTIFPLSYHIAWIPKQRRTAPLEKKAAQYLSALSCWRATALVQGLPQKMKLFQPLLMCRVLQPPAISAALSWARSSLQRLSVLQTAHQPPECLAEGTDRFPWPAAYALPNTTQHGAGTADTFADLVSRSGEMQSVIYFKLLP